MAVKLLRIRRSTLFAFENLRLAGRFVPLVAFSPRSLRHRDRSQAVIHGGAVFLYCSAGGAVVRDQLGSFQLVPGSYAVLQGRVSVALESSSRLVAVRSEPFSALRSCGGPVERKGRLRYVDSCSAPWQYAKKAEMPRIRCWWRRPRSPTPA